MLAKKITQDYIQAMKNKESQRAATLNFLRAQIKNVMIDQRVEELPDTEVISIIKKQVKQRQDSIRQYQDGGREELADKEKAELEILREYLPEEMPDDQLDTIIGEALKETGAQGMKDMGAVMKSALAKTGGRADNKRVSDLVRQKLSQI
ncbi:MAG: GatB/YqeY domain-containing protein [Candidatus Omnitrophota bacterium]